ncbi:hypothetical protein BH11PSE11_BH11PSE11_38050 [soil metagenome]
MVNCAELLIEAAAHLQSGRGQQAETACRQVLEQEPENTTAWYYLAMLAQQTGKLDAALDSVDRAIASSAPNLGYCMLKGLILQDLKQPALAGSCFRDAARLKPDSQQAWNNLGITLRDQQKFDAAIEAFGKAISINPRYFRAYNNLGMTFQSQGRVRDAIGSYQRAIQFDPAYYIAMHNLATAHMALGEESVAAEWFRSVMRLKPDYLPSCIAFGRWLLNRRNFTGAEEWCKRAVEIAPNSGEALHLLAELLLTQGKTDQAISAYRRAVQLDPRDLKSALGAALSLPYVYPDRATLQQTRDRYVAGLESLQNNVEVFAQNSPDNVVGDLKWNNFFLAYHGMDDKPVQKKYSEFMEDLLTRAVPQYMAPIPPKDTTGRRIRIGILSGFFHECTAGTYFHSWVTQLDRSKFEVFAYYILADRDDITAQVETAADHFRHALGLPLDIANTVRGDDLDVLIYPEIGMNAKAVLLSAMRLAPVQCAAWGHPVTTGHANIDYFFSSALMEPENGQDHYTEKLVTLPGIGTRYARPAPPASTVAVATRAEMALPEDKHLYLCPQSLFKIHPDNDDLLVRVLKQDEDGVLVFFASPHESVTNTFINRMVQAFARHGVDKSGRVKILPVVGHDHYLRLNMVCDVMLDTLYWSGGNTTLDAIACGLPIVTLPGEFMRGRQSMGMLSALGRSDLIASSEEDYVRIAVSLGKDSAYRMRTSISILNNLGKIFDDDAPMLALSDFLLNTVGKRQVSGDS